MGKTKKFLNLVDLARHSQRNLDDALAIQRGDYGTIADVLKDLGNEYGKYFEADGTIRPVDIETDDSYSEAYRWAAKALDVRAATFAMMREKTGFEPRFWPSDWIGTHLAIDVHRIASDAVSVACTGFQCDASRTALVSTESIVGEPIGVLIGIAGMFALQAAGSETRVPARHAARLCCRLEGWGRQAFEALRGHDLRSEERGRDHGLLAETLAHIRIVGELLFAAGDPVGDVMRYPQVGLKDSEDPSVSISKWYDYFMKTVESFPFDLSSKEKASIFFLSAARAHGWGHLTHKKTFSLALHHCNLTVRGSDWQDAFLAAFKALGYKPAKIDHNKRRKTSDDHKENLDPEPT